MKKVSFNKYESGFSVSTSSHDVISADAPSMAADMNIYFFIICMR